MHRNCRGSDVRRLLARDQTNITSDGGVEFSVTRASPKREALTLPFLIFGIAQCNRRRLPTTPCSLGHPAGKSACGHDGAGCLLDYEIAAAAIN